MRGILKRIAVVTALLLALFVTLAGYAFLIEPNRLVVRHETLELPGWSSNLNGLRVVAISDIHAGSPFINEAKLDKLVETANAQQPDVIVLLGDFLIQGVPGGSYMPPDKIASHLKNLRARYGVYAVLGNHDWWGDGAGLKRALESAGIRELENDAARIETSKGAFYIVGLSDLWTRRPNPNTALARIPSADAQLPVIAITHNPDLFAKLPARFALTLAGHTHGGQVRLPFIRRFVVPSRYGARYIEGHVVEDNRHLYVTTGVGTSILPVRFRVPPEIVTLELKSAN